MTQPTNCIICASEFDCQKLESQALSKINITRFKICQNCLDNCDPSEEYRQAKDIVNSYLWFAEARSSLQEVSDILKEIKKDQ